MIHPSTFRSSNRRYCRLVGMCIQDDAWNPLNASAGKDVAHNDFIYIASKNGVWVTYLAALNFKKKHWISSCWLLEHLFRPRKKHCPPPNVLVQQSNVQTIFSQKTQELPPHNIASALLHNFGSVFLGMWWFETLNLRDLQTQLGKFLSSFHRGNPIDFLCRAILG